MSAPATLPKTTTDLKKRISGQYPGADFNDFAKVYGGGEDDTAMEAYLALMRDVVFSSQMRWWARSTENVSSDAYVYYFTRVPPIPNSDYLGAYHAAEIAYAFQTISPDYEDVDRELSDLMSDYWVNFATNGDPNGKGLPKWEAYDSDTEPYMELGDSVKGGNHLLKTELDYLDGLMGVR